MEPNMTKNEERGLTTKTVLNETSPIRQGKNSY